MHPRYRSILLALGAAACASHQSMQQAPMPRETAAPAVRDGYTVVRAATEKFHNLDSAVAAGYARTVARCYDMAGHGAMGFHHVNRQLMDRQLDPERPEILLYERLPDGRYQLNGVEFIVPYSQWPKDSVPPTIMGRNLDPADDLNLWYMHMWVWKPNPAGLFASYNPTVRCPES